MQYRIKLLSKISSIILVAIGTLVIVGWLFNIPVLKSVLPGIISMKFDTALCFIFSGIVIWLLNNENLSFTQKVIFFFCSIFIVVMAAIQSCEYLFNRNLGIDELFIKDDLISAATTYAGRMAPATTLCFLLAGSVFFMLFFKLRNYKIAHTIVLFLFALSVFSFSGYLYGVEVFYGLLFYTTKMAIHTSFSFIILSIGLLTIQGNKGVITYFTYNDTIGKIVARLVIMIVVFEFFLGWLHLQGEKYEWFGASFGTSLFILTNIFILIGIVLWNARRLIREDKIRNIAEQKMKEQALILGEKNMQLNDFSNIVCHNLRGPLSSISMLMDYLEISEDEDEKKEMLNSSSKCNVM